MVKKVLYIVVLIIVMINIFPMNVSAGSEELMTKNDFKIFVSMINKRFEDINKRFDDVNKRFDDVNKRFDFMMWVMGIGFMSLAGISLFLYRLNSGKIDLLRENMDKRFEEVDKRFEEVMSIILLLVKAHEKEIGSETISVALGAKKMEDIAKEIENDFVKQVEERKKEAIKEYLKDPEIINLIATELSKIKGDISYISQT